ncbi:MAG TPA: aminotransferase class I/II-fold pyridoxal phosphate-dependent enzyme [Chitinophagaceae bacterium]
MQVARRLESINEYYFSQKLRQIEELNKTGVPVINLGIGSPDLPPHESVIKTLQEESGKSNVHAYQGYKGVKPLRDAMAAWYAKWYGVPLNPDTEILPLIGSKEGIMHICMTFLNEGDEALVPNPGYPTYRSAVLLAGAVCVDYDLREENDWAPDFAALEAMELSKVKIMWVNYPHMPTGQLPTEDLFERLVTFGKKHNILICHDNPYSFILNEKPASILAVEGATETALELNSLSKSHNMAGWRVGMLCGGKDKIDAVLRFKSNMDSGMFQPLQMAAVKALQLEQEWYDSLNRVYARRREKVFDLLELLHCTFSTEQSGMFIWAKIPSTYTSGYELSDEILERARVFITPGGIFGSAGDGYIRVSLCSPEERYVEAKKRIENKG